MPTYSGPLSHAMASGWARLLYGGAAASVSQRVDGDEWQVDFGASLHPLVRQAVEAVRLVHIAHGSRLARRSASYSDRKCMPIPAEAESTPPPPGVGETESRAGSIVCVLMSL